MNLPPPSDGLSENALLGSALITDTAAKWFYDNIQPEFFYSDQNRYIAQAIRKLIEEGVTAEQVTLGSKLREMGKYAEAGGVEKIAKIVHDVVTAANIEDYGNNVARLYYSRETMKASVKMSDAITRGDIEGRDDAFNEMAKLFADHNAIDRMEFLSAKDSMINLMVRIDEKKAPPGIFLGLDELDAILGGSRRGHVVTVASRTGIGKTASLASFGYHIAKKYRVAYFAAEMTGDEVSMRVAASESKIDHLRVYQNQIRRDEIPRYQDATSKLSERSVFYSEVSRPSLRDIRSFGNKMACDVIIVDHLGRCKHPNGESKRVQIDAFMSGLKDIAKEEDRLILLGAQVNRGAEKEQDRPPMLSDLKESSTIEEESDAVILLHARREDMDAPNDVIDLQFHVAKNRHGRTGKAIVPFNRRIMSIGTQGGPIPSQSEAFQKDFQKAAAGDFDGEGF